MDLIDVELLLIHFESNPPRANKVINLHKPVYNIYIYIYIQWDIYTLLKKIKGTKNEIL